MKRMPLFYSRGKFSMLARNKLSPISTNILKLQSVYDKPMAIWLFISAGLVFGIVVVGGVTRLTESGLSMVDWSLLHYKPPLTNQEWEDYFSKYQSSPEYHMLNQGMTVEEFKRIYYMEYGHRMLGRILGAVYLIPMCYFMLTRKNMNKSTKKNLLMISALILFQGFLGWYMVKSGLDPSLIEKNEHPRVSPYRLTAHLSLAFVIYLLTLREGLKAAFPVSTNMMTNLGRKKLSWLTRSTVLSSKLIFLTAISGAFVAGLDAGMIYNTFPKMGNHWIPSDGYTMIPLWKDFFENPSTAQFHHRILGTTSLVCILSTWYYGTTMKSILPTASRRLLHAFAGVALAQVGLGIATLLYVVPIPLASAHQAGSLTLLTVALSLVHCIKRIPK